MRSIYPCLWFDHQAEEAARFYVSIFPGSKITGITRYGPSSSKASGRPEGSVLTVEFELDGHRMLALNGGPVFRLSEAMSIVVPCKDQKEIDRVWAALTKGGEETACGWLKDRYGLSWQVVPESLSKWIADSDPERAERVMAALLTMKKLDAAVLERAYAGSAPAKKSAPPKTRGVASPRT